MKRLLACLALCASFSASAQVIYPYNPDANGDSQITSGDLLDFLPVFATTFTPQGITIDGLPLDEWLIDLEDVVYSNADAVDHLFAIQFDMQTQINELEAENSSLQAQINSIQNQLNNLSFNVDGLPPCVDIDDDGVCDFADPCYGVSLDFTWDDNNQSSCLNPGGVYPYALLEFENLAGAYLVGIDLSHSNLYETNLANANLTGAYLIDSNLDNVNLFNANLSGADLANANVSANLSGANLTSANLAGTHLGYANLSNADLSGAYLVDASLHNANLSGANLSGANMNCLISGCPSLLPSGYICEPQPDCSEPERFRIVLE